MGLCDGRGMSRPGRYEATGRRHDSLGEAAPELIAEGACGAGSVRDAAEEHVGQCVCVWGGVLVEGIFCLGSFDRGGFVWLEIYTP